MFKDQVVGQQEDQQKDVAKKQKYEEEEYTFVDIRQSQSSNFSPISN
jgi:hypothetical protein